MQASVYPCSRRLAHFTKLVMSVKAKKNNHVLKRAGVLLVALVMLFSAVYAAPSRTVAQDMYEVSDFAGTAPEKEGCVFAGWFTDDTCSTSYTASSGMAYAKFVSRDVLGVKYQINEGTDTQCSSTKLRIITTVDSLDYSRVGFIVQYSGEKPRELTTGTVFRRLTGFDGVSALTYKPTVFSAESLYFCAYIFTVPADHFATDFSITPLWITLDGTRVTGVERTINVSESPSFASNAAITGHEITGTWTNDRQTVGSTAYGPARSYDKDPATFWNPQAADFNSGEGIIYTLDKPYDLTKVQLSFAKVQYFDLYASTDGADYTLVSRVGRSNAVYYYNNNKCTVSGLSIPGTTHIKVVFSENTAANLWVSLYEVTVIGKNPEKWTDPRPVLTAGITAYELTGSWATDRITTGVSASLAPDRTYDGNLSSAWNPRATDYKSGEGIIYTLDKPYDLETIGIVFSSRDMYLTVSVSEDGAVFSSVATVDRTNAGEYYAEYVFTAVDLSASGVQYVKLEFSGSSDNGLWVNMYEISFTGRDPAAIEELSAPVSPDDPQSPVVSERQETAVTICSHELTGAWVKEYTTGNPPEKSYDGNAGNMWNPQAGGGYAGAPGIIYKLDAAYDLTQIVFTFGIRPYYFDLYASSYGTEYSRVAQVTSANADSYYNGYVCTINFDSADNVQYIKLIFTGSGGNGSLYVALNETEVSGYVTGDVPDLSAGVNPTARLTAVDALGRSTGGSETPGAGKAVGVFYFLWVGAFSTEGPYDVSKIKASDPEAGRSDEAWRSAGGGAVGQRHWWGESLFGYYRADDAWVVERDVMMLTDAGVDFLAIDYSNASEYPKQLLVLLAALDKYYSQGFNVPRITFITKESSGQVVMDLYNDFYLGHPEYDHLWYRLESKPLMIGVNTSVAVSAECRDYFTWRWPQWPREAYRDDGFPWVDFSEPQTLYGQNTGTTVMSVSVAQHSGTLAFSSSALYGDTSNRTRSWHDGANDTSQDAVLCGYNFAQQFEYAIAQDPDIIFVTGWNEWIATRQSVWNALSDPVILVDCCDINNSRDIQPMKGGYGDNYYMQLVSYINQYKGQSAANSNLNTAAPVTRFTIDPSGSFEQWNAVRPFYLDYTGDTADRDHAGFGSLYYTDTTGRSDIYKMKMVNDGEKLYAYVETKEAITGMDSERCMTLFISTGSSGGWNGYDFVIGRAAAGETLSVEQWDGNEWADAGTAQYLVSGNKLQLAVDLSLLGISAGDLSLEFKWADNYQDEDIYSFYLYGDSAPYGRLNYVYSGP